MINALHALNDLLGSNQIVAEVVVAFFMVWPLWLVLAMIGWVVFRK